VFCSSEVILLHTIFGRKFYNIKLTGFSIQFYTLLEYTQLNIQCIVQGCYHRDNHNIYVYKFILNVGDGQVNKKETRELTCCQ